MKTRNHYNSVPQGDDDKPLRSWWNVESEPGIAVAGEDHVFDVETQEEAEQMARTLAAHTDEKLTVVEHRRVEYVSYQRVSEVRKVES